MHQTAQFLYAMSAVCRNSYSPPVAMPRAMEIGMHVSLAVFFFFITHARHGGLAHFTSAEFYMAHVWGLLAAEAMRATVYRVATEMLLPRDEKEE